MRNQGTAARPRSIQLFEMVFFAYFAVGIVNTLLSWRAVAAAAEDPVLKAAGIGQEVVVSGLLLGVLLPLLLWYFIARRASNVAKWIYVVLTALGILGFVRALAAGPGGGALGFVLAALALALEIYGARLLFKADAKAWLDSGGSDPGTHQPIS